jgi:hypothetical protein
LAVVNLGDIQKVCSGMSLFSTGLSASLFFMLRVYLLSLNSSAHGLCGPHNTHARVHKCTHTHVHACCSYYLSTTFLAALNVRNQQKTCAHACLHIEIKKKVGGAALRIYTKHTCAHTRTHRGL